MTGEGEMAEMVSDVDSQLFYLPPKTLDSWHDSFPKISKEKTNKQTNNITSETAAAIPVPISCVKLTYLWF